MLPNFFVAGAQKAATTTLHNYLVGHPEIYLPEQKETKFFIEDRFYNKGINFYDEKFFSDWSGESAIGEIDPDYMYFDIALDRISEHFDLAKIKFIFLLRNPVDRAFSHYLMTYRRGFEPLSFEDAIEQESSRIADGDYHQKLHCSYISRGFYLRQIERFIERAGSRSQILFLLTEDLNDDPDSCIKKIFQFLEVSTDYVPENLGNKYHGAKVPVNAAFQQRIAGGTTIEKRLIRLLIPWQPWREKLRNKLLSLNQKSGKGHTLSDATRRKLIEIYQPENRRLEKFLGCSLQHWDYVDTVSGVNE